MFSTLCAVPKKEGYLGLYKGNGAMMIRIFPYGAIQFMAFDQYKKVVEFILFSFFLLPTINTDLQVIDTDTVSFESY